MMHIRISLFLILIAFGCSKTIKNPTEDGDGFMLTYCKSKIETPYLKEYYTDDKQLIGLERFNEKGQLIGESYKLTPSGDSIVKYHSKFPNCIEVRRYLANGEEYHTFMQDSFEIGISRHYVDGKLYKRGLHYRNILFAYEEYNYSLPKYIELISESDDSTNSESILLSTDRYSSIFTQFRLNGEQTGYYSVGKGFIMSDSIDPEYSTYCVLETEDLVGLNDSIEAIISGSDRLLKDTQFEIYLSNIDSLDALTGFPFTKLVSNKSPLHISNSFAPVNIGYHFVVGSIFMNNEIHNKYQQFIVFDDFIVR